MKFIRKFLNKKVFTLIELLVVISIIAILASLLLPALGKAKERVTQLECASRLKGWGAAVLMYSTDHSSEFPNAYVYGTVSFIWYINLAEYINSKNPKHVYFPHYSSTDLSCCPSTLKNSDLVLGNYIPNLDVMGYDISGSGILDESLMPKKIERIKRASRSFLFYCKRSDATASGCPRLGRTGVMTGANAGYYHGGGMNILFIDGHVEWQKRPSVGLYNDVANNGGNPNDNTLSVLWE